MNKKNTIIGVALILLGISIYLRNFHIGAGSLITCFIGLGLLYTYTIKREQPFLIFGGIFTAIGLMEVFKDIGMFRFDLTFETLLIVLGLIFILIYYSKNVQGLIIPGMILPAIGVYLILEKSFNGKYVDSSIFFLLGFAFYAIYFIAYMGKSNWPLIPATILLLAGILAYAIRFEVITRNMIFLNRDYILPLLMIGAGIIILLSLIKRRQN